MSVPIVVQVPTQLTPRQQGLVTGQHFDRVAGVFLYDQTDDTYMPVSEFQVQDGEHLRFTVRSDTPAGAYFVVLVDLDDEQSAHGSLSAIEITPVLDPPVAPTVDYTIPDEVVAKVRLELQDNPRTFQTVASGDGVSTRYELDVHPVEGSTLNVLRLAEGAPPAIPMLPGVDYVVSEREGVIMLTIPLADLDVLVVSGTSYRLFTDTEIRTFIDTAFQQQSLNRTIVTHAIDPATGLKQSTITPLTYTSMDLVEMQPLAILAAIQALWVLATDAAYDIDIGEDGASIPRSERVRQLMGMIQAQQGRYSSLAEALNIGLTSIEQFTLRRRSGTTGRLVPVYVEKEYDDHSPPVRVYPPINAGAAANQQAVDPYYTEIGP